MAQSRALVEVLVEPTTEHIEMLSRILPQLSNATPPDLDTLRAIAQHPGTSLLVARDSSGTIIGMLTLVTFRIPTGVRAWIEDVVVDAQVRRSGAGTALVNRAIELAAAAGAVTVDLTSRPSRLDANRLYVALGFTRRETNVYRFELEQ